MTIAYRDLSRERCLLLLERSAMGRLAYCAESTPRIYPLNFALHGEAIVFRTAAYTTLGTEIDGREVAFEVDEVDEVDGAVGHGWSIVVNGRAELVSDPDEAAELRRVADPQPWAPGVRSLYVRIPIRRISGRAIGEI
jgi:uncharacterized protein